jgi:DNA-binding transcriptional LysR family regulator
MNGRDRDPPVPLLRRLGRGAARAAANLDISPPTLTNQIQKLESALGAKLVDRRGNTHVELTAAGKRFLDRARSVLREVNEAAAVARQAARGETGRIDLGFITVAAMAGMVGKLIGGFQRANPGIEINLKQMVTLEQIRALVAKELDFGFLRPPQRYPSDLQGFVIYRQPMLLALPSDHPLAAQKRIEPSRLKGEPFINTAPELEVGFWKHTDALGTMGSFTPKVAKRAQDMISVLSYVSAGHGVAVVSQAFRGMEVPNVVYREFATPTPPIAQIALVYRRGETSPACQALIKFVRLHGEERSSTA